MRNKGPLMGNVVIHGTDPLLASVVFPGNLAVQFRNRVTRERLSLFGRFVEAQFKFGKLRLAEDRSLNIFEISTEQRQSGRAVLSGFEHVVDQECLVERRGNFSHEE